MPSRKSVRPEKKENRKRPQKKKGPKGTAAPAGPAVKAGAREGGDELIVVGIGASAGGLEAVSELLEAMPVNTGMAFVVVQHIAPRHTSALPSPPRGARRL